MKLSTIILYGIIVSSLIVRLIILNSHLKDKNYSIQQDNYADYAFSLKNKLLKGLEISKENPNTRLFPGYPILILLVNPIFKSEVTAGLAISLFSSVMSIYFFWLLTKNLTATGIFSFFPPIWVIQSTKVSSEPLVVLLLLSSILLYRCRFFFFSGIVLGFASDVRLISICLLAALIIHLVLDRKGKDIISLIAGFVLLFSLLMFFNYLIFGLSELFQQFAANLTFGRATFGGLQLLKDVFRAIDWGQYRILISGIFYLLINFFALFQLFKHKKISGLYQISFFWMLFSLIFIFLLSPTPLLEEFSRYSVPFVPALILGFFTFSNKIRKLRINNSSI